MNRFHAPEDSVTEQSVRMAHANEYMVPVETAWALEQRLNDALAECDRLRAVQSSQDKAFDHLAKDLHEAREECHRLYGKSQEMERTLHGIHQVVMRSAL